MVREARTPSADRAVARVAVLALSLGTLLGLLLMHVTPVLTAAANSRADTALVATLGSPAAHLAVGQHGPAPVDIGLHPGDMSPTGGGDDTMPAGHHAASPCVSDTTRSSQLPLPGLSATVTLAAGTPPAAARQAARATSGQRSPPPDLQKLCISRT